MKRYSSVNIDKYPQTKEAYYYYSVLFQTIVFLLKHKRPHCVTGSGVAETLAGTLARGEGVET